MDTGQRPTVAHFRSTWLGLTETFIYQYVSHLRRFRPVVFCTETENLGQFAVNPLVVCPKPRPGSPLSAACAVARRTFGWRAADAVVRPRLAAAIRQYSPALVHAHFATDAAVVLPICIRLRLPLVTSFYGVDASQYAVLRRYGRHYRRLFEAGDLFLVEGPEMRERVAALGCPPDKIRMQHIAVDLSRLPFRPRRPPQGEGAVRVLFVGRFVEKKGVLDAIAAFEAAGHGSPPMELRVIGDGPLRRQVEALIAELRLSERVRLLGYVPYHEMLKELDEAHILLAPSKTASNGDTEGGAPTVLLEAQASGLPIVSTRHADIPYVLSPPAAARLCEEGDVFAVASALAELAAHPDSWVELAASGRAHVEERHDIARAAPQLERVYDEVLRYRRAAITESHASRLEVVS